MGAKESFFFPLSMFCFHHLIAIAHCHRAMSKVGCRVKKNPHPRPLIAEAIERDYGKNKLII